jgi:hypothetical protein
LDIAKVAKGMFIAMSAYIKSREITNKQANNAPQALGRATKPKNSRWKEIIKIREEINKRE